MRDLTRTTRTVLAGAVGVTVGWVGASGTALISRQLLWAAVSVAGVILAGMGMVSWLLAGLRVVYQVSQEALAPLHTQPRTPSAVTSAVLALPTTGAAMVTAPGMTRFHNADCLLVRGKRVEVVPAAGHALRPCGVCRP
jgi:hypothetical protein